MILQSLVKLYEDLAAQGKIAPDGWGSVKTSFAVCLDENGAVTQLIPLVKEVVRGKKTVTVPQELRLPAPITKTSGKASNFLWENANYLLGIPKDETEKGCKDASERFAFCRDYHHSLLNDAASPTAQAILQFFDTWDVLGAADHPAVKNLMDDLRKGGNLTFRVNGKYAFEDPVLAAVWEEHYFKSNGETMQCLVTGKELPYELTHPKVKGVNGAQSSGASLVSFNAPAFCSYNREQNANAPVSKYAAFAYTSALNYLLADRDNVQHIGDASIVCWADGADPAYQSFSFEALFGDERQGYDIDAVRAAVARLAQGLPVEELGLEPEKTFYILGLSPNSSRLSVRFFLRDAFGNIMKNVNAHHDRMEIIKPANDRFSTIPLWALLSETVNPNSKDKAASPVLAGAVARAIFSGGPYPASLLESVMLRIHAERNITRGKAAIIKAYYLKNQSEGCPKEVLTVSLNENSTNVAYNLGRMFSVFEAIQEKANPGINSTIKDKYFNSAAASPATIFPVLDNLSQKHLRKLDERSQVYFGKTIGELKDKFGEAYPARLSLPEQGSFYLGYYHQTQKRYTKKEEN
ncbi:MAG: type I-C CRISPR-associated protein Cas8c/Csd1 [Lachnospiraceae bacterium]|nr:type I-C CRISPR-associated protein Cas8c/Csd1 [Lachnospiraceae bacterium]